MSETEVGIIVIVTKPFLVDASKWPEAAPVTFLSRVCPVEGCRFVEEVSQTPASNHFCWWYWAFESEHPNVLAIFGFPVSLCLLAMRKIKAANVLMLKHSLNLGSHIRGEGLLSQIVVMIRAMFVPFEWNVKIF